MIMDNNVKQKRLGFSLIELLIVLLILSILLAYPLLGMRQQINRTHRLEGQIALFDLANRMERYYAKYHTYQYASIATGSVHDVQSRALSEGGWYTLRILSANKTTYLLQATLTAEHRNQNQSCDTLTLSNHGEIQPCC